MARGVPGVAVASAAAGSVMLYGAVTNKSPAAVLRALIGGRRPATAAANPLTALTPAQAASSSAVPPAGSAGAASASAAANQAIGRLLAAARGWGAGQEWDDLVSLWNRESGWDSLIINPSSGAFGIAQALGHGTAGSGVIVPLVRTPGGGTRANVSVNQYPSAAANAGGAAAQIGWGLRYIAQRYGTPSAAWAHETSAGSY